MSDFAETAVILAVAAVLFFGLGVYFAGGRKREDGNGAAPETQPEPRAAPEPDPRVEKLRQQLAEAEARVELLEGDLHRARREAAGASAEEFVAAGDVHTDPELGVVYAARPEDSDDLTKIRGVGKALAKQLNDLGVFKLSQIAAWEKPQVAAFSSRFAFRDRISRDDWVGQAKRLAR
jgi:predicted flap endonuclease-1-like 5' DNA nuclease